MTGRSSVYPLACVPLFEAANDYPCLYALQNSSPPEEERPEHQAEGDRDRAAISPIHACKGSERGRGSLWGSYIQADEREKPGWRRPIAPARV